jgi:hypothetical protein
MTEETSPVDPTLISAVSASDIVDGLLASEPADPAAGFPSQEDRTIQDSTSSTGATDAASGGSSPDPDAGPPGIHFPEAEANPIRENVYQDSQAPAPGGADSEDVHGGYAAIAAVATDSQLSIGMAGLVANNLSGPVTVAPQIRIRDVLTGSPVDRVAVRDDPAYAETEEWEQARQAAAQMLPDNRVLIVVAPRGYGSTTFSLRLLACHVSSDAELIRLEADWGTPRVGRLPLQKNRAYQIDLQDPDHDRFDSAFLNSLGKHAMDLRALGSYLVLNVASELWQAHYGRLPSGVAMRRLDNPPDAEELVERHLKKRSLGSVIPYIKREEAARHIKGRDAVQAMRAVEVVEREWVEYGKRNFSDRKASEDAAAATSSADWESSPLDAALQHAIAEALGDWEDDLKALFDEPPGNQSDDRSLLPEDRCLLMSLALRQSGTAAAIQSAALALERSLTRNGRGANGTSANAWNVFSRRGLRPRLKAFEATIDAHDGVTFKRPGYAEAVLAYVWDNYSGLQEDLISWMTGCAAADGQEEDPVAETLTELLLRLQDAGRLISLRDSAIAQDRRAVIVRVMTAAATNEHMGRRARSLLYDWAGSQRPDIQQVVIAVCRQLIATKEGMALVRLRRVANNAADTDVRLQILAVFKEAASRKQVTARFAEAVASWQNAEPSSQAVKLGLLALLAIESDGAPWIPGHATAIDVTEGLRELLSDPRWSMETIETTVSWVRSCTQDPGLHTSALKLIGAAIRDRHAFSAGMALMRRLTEVETPGGGSAGEDLYTEIVDPGLRAFNPLTQPSP